ncbi:MAG: TonB-dependent receptor plug domain-containing protein [Telluria sp.]
MTLRARTTALAAAVCCLTAAAAWAQQAPTSEEDELALVYGDKSTVSIATGSAQALSRAPSTATVITAEDIAAMGATDLDQVLETVPGLHVGTSVICYNPIYSFRGSYTGYNPQVLMLVNGQPITALFGGHRSFAWGGMPVENIARIEVIRGPGSALYGADAFTGVINIVTKSADDLDGLEYGLRVGSFRERDAFLQYGGKHGDFKYSYYLRAGHTDGAPSIIDADLSTTLDNVFHTHTSHAPGPVNNVRDMLDARTDLQWQDWRLRLAVQKRNIGIGAGLAESLDPDGRSPETRFYSDLTWHRANVVPAWDLSVTLGYYQMRESPGDPYYRLFPPGAFGGLFPNGVIGAPGHFERHSNLNVSAIYTGMHDHRLLLGTGYRLEDLYGNPEFKNFDLKLLPGVGPVFVPLPGIVESSGNPELRYISLGKRMLRYAVVQDEWNLAKDWTLTAGIRHDRYSDFGGTTNPRVALVWDAAYDLVIKALVGRAFRAPSFVEMYTLNNPVNFGNPAIVPEKITSKELDFVWNSASAVQSTLSLFHYRMTDIIVATPNPDPSTGITFQNAATQTGRGAELELTWTPTRSLRLNGSLSLQKAENGQGQSPGLAPERHLATRADWRFAPDWQLGLTANHVARRLREPGDTRPPVPDYTSVDLTLQRSRLGNWEVRLIATNLFDADVREPTFAPGNIPHDLPMPGRAFRIEFLHHL